MFEAFATGLAEARGECVYLHSADDRVLPGFIERSLELLARHPEAGLCCFDPASFEDGSAVIRRNALSWSEAPRYFTPDAFAEIVTGGAIAGHTAIVRLDAFRDVGGYRPELRWHCDWFAWLAIAFRRGVCYIPDALAAIRSHGASYGAPARRDRAQQREVLAAILRLLQSPGYRDLLLYFARGSVLSHFGDEIVRTVQADPGLWSVETAFLIEEPLHVWSRTIGQAIERRTADGCRPTRMASSFRPPMRRLWPGSGAGLYGLLARCATHHPRAEAVERFFGAAMLMRREEVRNEPSNAAWRQRPTTVGCATWLTRSRDVPAGTSKQSVRCRAASRPGSRRPKPR